MFEWLMVSHHLINISQEIPCEARHNGSMEKMLVDR